MGRIKRIKQIRGTRTVSLDARKVLFGYKNSMKFGYDKYLTVPFWCTPSRHIRLVWSSYGLYFSEAVYFKLKRSSKAAMFFTGCKFIFIVYFVIMPADKLDETTIHDNNHIFRIFHWPSVGVKREFFWKKWSIKQKHFIDEKMHNAQGHICILS